MYNLPKFFELEVSEVEDWGAAVVSGDSFPVESREKKQIRVMDLVFLFPDPDPHCKESILKI
jgi:hypothetical protein